MIRSLVLVALALALVVHHAVPSAASAEAAHHDPAGCLACDQDGDALDGLAVTCLAIAGLALSLLRPRALLTVLASARRRLPAGAWSGLRAHAGRAPPRPPGLPILCVLRR